MGEPSDTANGQLQSIAIIREIREEAKNLHEALSELISLLEVPEADPNALAQLTASTTKELQDNRDDIGRRLGELRTLLSGDGVLRDQLGDTETRLTNLWKKADREWSRPDAGLAALSRVRAQLYQLVLEAAHVTIPPRLNQNLESGRIGAAFDFHAEFADEVIDEPQSAKVLDWIYRHPRSAQGVIDKERGVIFKASPSRTVQTLTLLSVVVVAGLAVASPMLREVVDLDDVVAPDVTNEAKLAGAVAFGLVGALVHVLVGTMKETQRANRNGAEPPTLGNWVLWIHVRYLSLWCAVAGVVVAVLAGAHLSRGTDPVTMIAMGYSADSIVDLVVPKVTKLMTKRSEVVTKALA